MDILDRSKIQAILSKHDVELPEEQLKRLENGLISTLVENVKFGEHEFHDAKFQFSQDNDGQLHYKAIPVQDELEIPKKIFSHELTEEETEKLLDHKAILIEHDGNPLKLSVDPELNTVVVSNPSNELKPLEEIGDYQLSNKEKEAFLNGEQIGPKVLYDKKTKTHILASFSKTEDGKGLAMQIEKDIPADKVDEYKQRFNTHDKPQEAAINIATSLVETQTPKLAKDFIQAIENKDFATMDQLSEDPQIKHPAIAKAIYASQAYNNLTNEQQGATQASIGVTVAEAQTMVSPETIQQIKQSENPQDDLTRALSDKTLTEDQFKDLSKHFSTQHKEGKLTEDSYTSLQVAAKDGQLTVAKRAEKKKKQQNQKMSNNVKLRQ